MDRNHSRVRRLMIAAPFVLVIGVGVGVEFWMSRHTGSFRSDEAIVGIMGLHVRQGEAPVYHYGNRHLGSLDALLAGVSMSVFEPGVGSLRNHSVVLYGVWLVLNAVVLTRFWGRRVALTALLFLAFPTRLLLVVTSTPEAAFGPHAVLGMLAIAICYPTGRREAPLTRSRWFVLGAVLGLAMWTHPMAIAYVTALGAAGWFQTDEWARVSRRLAEWSDRRVRIPSGHWLPLVTAAVVCLAILALFSDGCRPQVAFTTPEDALRILGECRQAAMLVLLAVGAAAVLAFLAASRRRGKWLGAGVLLGAGLALGNGPRLYAWLAHGVTPGANVWPTCPTGIAPRLWYVARDLLPTMWGIPYPFPAAVCERPALEAVAWLVLAAGMIGAVVWFVWSNRLVFWSLVSWAPVRRDQAPEIIFGVLFALPVVLVVLSNNVHNPHSVRYLVVAWQAAAVILAVFVVRAADRLGRAGVLVLTFLALWTYMVGYQTLAAAHAEWRRSEWDKPNVQALEAYMHERGLPCGVSHYWAAYALDFVTQERVVFDTYNTPRRYEPYRVAAENATLLPYVFFKGEVPGGDASLETLVEHFRSDQALGGRAFPDAIARLGGMTVVERRRVADWDVWLMRESERIAARYWPCDLLTRHGERVEVADPRDGRAAEVIQVGPRAKGLAAFGVPLSLRPGRYVAELDLGRHGRAAPADRVLADVRVGLNRTATLLARESVAAGAWREGESVVTVRVPFELHLGRPDVQVYATAGGATLHVYEIRITRPGPGE